MRLILTTVLGVVLGIGAILLLTQVFDLPPSVGYLAAGSILVSILVVQFPVLTLQAILAVPLTWFLCWATGGLVYLLALAAYLSVMTLSAFLFRATSAVPWFSNRWYVPTLERKKSLVFACKRQAMMWNAYPFFPLSWSDALRIYPQVVWAARGLLIKKEKL